MSADTRGHLQSDDSSTESNSNILEAGNGAKILDEREPSPEITYHVEPVVQGGKEFVRCEGCGAELLVELGGEGSLIHREGCPAGEGR